MKAKQNTAPIKPEFDDYEEYENDVLKEEKKRKESKTKGKG